MPDPAMSALCEYPRTASYGETSYASTGGFRPTARIGIGKDNNVGLQDLGYSYGLLSESGHAARAEEEPASGSLGF
jgi:hypothetical protein